MAGVVTELRALSRSRGPASGTRATRGRSCMPAVLGAFAWISIIVIAHVLLERLQRGGYRIKIDAAPLTGVFDFRASWKLVFAVVVGAAVAVAGPKLARRLGWRALLLAAPAAVVVWALALALIDGPSGLTRPLEYRSEYLAGVPRVGSPAAFLSTFVDRIRDYPVHVQGHPPGLVLVLWILARLGLAGPAWGAALFIGGGALAVPATLVAVREVAGEQWARRAAPFAVLTPAAIWIASSADAFYAGIGAWSVALVVLGTGRRAQRASVCALAGGCLFGFAAFLSYGLVLIGVIPAVVAWQRRRVRPLVLAALGALAVCVAFFAAGFSWTGGLLATRARYLAGVASHRPYLDFLVANLASLAIVLGPAIVIALLRLRDRRLWIILGGAVLAIAIALVSGLSKGEVERIWLPFAVWLLPAGAVLAGTRDRVATAWLSLQAMTAITVASVVKTRW